MSARRAHVALALALFMLTACAAAGCAPKAPPPRPPPPPAVLHIEPACDVAPAAGLEWLIDAKPRAIAQNAELIPAIALVLPEARLAAFTLAHGGVDPRQIQELCVARYKRDKRGLLVIARTPIDPARVEAAFAERTAQITSRLLVIPNPPVVRLSGDSPGGVEHIAIFGRDLILWQPMDRAAATEKSDRNDPLAIRVAEAFALGKLRRAQPALRGAALTRADALLGEAPVRAFAPGPFEGDVAKGLGGLLRASTAVGVAARLAPRGRIELRIVLTGAWGKDASAAAERLAAAVHVASESSTARLLGLNAPVVAPHVSASDEAIVLEETLDGMTLARGLHDALDAEVAEIMRR